MKFSTSLLIIVSLSKLAAAYPTPLEFSIVEKRDDEERKGYVQVIAEKTKGSTYSKSKVGNEPYIHCIKNADGTVEYNLENAQTFYSVEMEVGSDSQSVKLLIDTGSSDMWVVENDGKWCKGSSGNSTSSSNDSYDDDDDDDDDDNDDDDDDDDYDDDYDDDDDDYDDGDDDNSDDCDDDNSDDDDDDNSDDDDDDDDDDDNSDDWWSSIKKRIIPSRILTGYGSIEKRDDNPGNVDGQDWNWATGDPFAYFSAPESTGTASESVPQATYDCAKYGTFNPDSSDSWKSNDTDFSITYADKSYANGTWGQDTVTVNGAKIDNMNFASVSDSTSEMGVLGIGYEYLESGYDGDQSSIYDNLPLKLKLEGLIDKVTYSIYLNDSESGSANVLFGGLDTDKFVGELTSLPIINEHGSPKPYEIAVTLSSIALGSSANGTKTDLANGKAKAILDTGTTLSYIPFDILKAIVKELNLQLSLYEGFFMMECSAAEDYYLSFNFQGLEIDIPLESFLLNISVDEGSKKGEISQLCAIAILPEEEDLLLGDVFLRSVYMVVDLEDNVVALAPANLDSNSENIEVISGDIPSATAAPNAAQTWTSGAPFTTVAPQAVSGTPVNLPKTAA